MKIKVGISKCLLGECCRFDGGHKKDDFITQKLSKYCEFIPFCPEEEILGTPRESIRLVLENESIRVKGNKSGEDFTDKLKAISQEGTKNFKQQDIRGFIFKAKSPSCGFERVKLYNLKGDSIAYKESGIFAKELIESFEYIAIEDEARLNDSWLRENFILNLFAFSDLMEFLDSNPKPKDLVDFHSRYKFLLLSKNQKLYYEIGKVVGNQTKIDFDEILSEYKKIFILLLKEKSSRKKSLNTLEHIFGFFKKLISRDEKEDILISFREFKDGLIPLIVPIKLLQLYIKKYDIEYLKHQKYLNPYPDDLALRSDIKALK